MNSLFLGFAVYFVSYLLVDFLCKKLSLEKLIKDKTSIRISIFLIAILFNIVGTSIIKSFITREYGFLIKSFLGGATLYFMVFAFIWPVNKKKSKL